MHQPESNIGDWPYWKFEAFIERLNKRNDEIKSSRKKEEEEMRKQQANSGIGKFNPGSFMNKFKK